MNIITFALCFSLLALDSLSQVESVTAHSCFVMYSCLVFILKEYGGYEDWMKEKCCPVMTVESASDETKNEMFALVEEVPWSKAKKENCSSNCAYVKMKELKIVMEEMMNMTNMEMDKTTTAPTRIGESEEDMEMMSMLFGKEQAMKIKMKMKINRLQKYCFKPTDRDMQSMCAAPDMDMNIFENLELLGKLLLYFYNAQLKAFQPCFT